MGRKKKRKISKKIEEGEEQGISFDLNGLRKELVKLFSERRLSTVLNGTWSRMSISRWERMSIKQKVSEVLAKSSSRSLDSREYHPLMKLMKKVKFVDLLKIYKKNVSNKNLNRSVLVIEILYKFYDKVSPLEKRENEENNINSAGNLDEMLRFVVLCEITIPFVILKIIFSYLPRNLRILEKVSLNKSLYLSFLVTWPHVKVTRQNLYKLSILALRSVSSITIDTTKKYQAADLNYLFTHLSNRLRKITVKGSNNSTILGSMVKHAKSTSKKVENLVNDTFSNLVEIDVHGLVVWSRHWGISIGRRDRLGEIMPKLHTIIGVRKFTEPSLQQNNNIQRLGFTELPRILFNAEKTRFQHVTNISFTRFPYSSFNTEKSLPSDKNYGIASFVTLNKFIQLFPNVTELSFLRFFTDLEMNIYSFGVGKDQSTTKVKSFDFSVFSQMKNLQKLVIGCSKKDTKNYFHVSQLYYLSRPTTTGGYYEVVYNSSGFSSTLQVLELHCSKSNFKYDFNLYDILRSHFLTSFPNLKKFVAGDLNLFPQKKSKKVKHQLHSRRLQVIDQLFEFIILSGMQMSIDIEVVTEIRQTKITEKLRMVFQEHRCCRKMEVSLLNSSVASLSGRESDFFVNSTRKGILNSEKTFLWLKKSFGILCFSLCVTDLFKELGSKKGLVDIATFKILDGNSERLEKKKAVLSTFLNKEVEKNGNYDLVGYSFVRRFGMK